MKACHHEVCVYEAHEPFRIRKLLGGYYHGRRWYVQLKKQQDSTRIFVCLLQACQRSRRMQKGRHFWKSSNIKKIPFHIEEFQPVTQGKQQILYENRVCIVQQVKYWILFRRAYAIWSIIQLKEKASNENMYNRWKKEKKSYKYLDFFVLGFFCANTYAIDRLRFLHLDPESHTFWRKQNVLMSVVMMLVGVCIYLINYKINNK